MMKWVLVFVCLSTSALAYVPTVESLFRHGSNLDVTANGVNVTFVVKRLEAGAKDPQKKGDESLLAETKSEDFYKMFFTKVGSGATKVAQTRYDNSSYSEGSLLEKRYYPNFNAYTIKGTPEASEKGIFQAMLHSMIFNDGALFVNYLKSLGVPVKLNSEIINRKKVEYLAAYKKYLIATNKDRTKKPETNPLKPEDLSEREKVEQIMRESMYVDQDQVKLSREGGQMAWLITAGPFEAVISYKQREIQKIRYKSQLGDYEIICKDYWLANGSHALPRYIMVKDFKGEAFQIEITNLRHYPEKDVDIANRLKKWDGLLKGKESLEPKPPFLL